MVRQYLPRQDSHLQLLVVEDGRGIIVALAQISVPGSHGHLERLATRPGILLHQAVGHTVPTLEDIMDQMILPDQIMLVVIQPGLTRVAPVDIRRERLIHHHLTLRLVVLPIVRILEGIMVLAIQPVRIMFPLPVIQRHRTAGQHHPLVEILLREVVHPITRRRIPQVEIPLALVRHQALHHRLQQRPRIVDQHPVPAANLHQLPVQNRHQLVVR